MLFAVGTTVRSDHHRGDLVAWAAAVLCLAGTWLWPSGVEAAVVSVRPATNPAGFPFGRELAFVAGRGERNATVVQAAYAGTPWTVRDPGAVITPGEGCTAHDAHTVSCAAPPANLSSRSAPGSFETTLDGGGGRDELRGGDGPESLTDGD